MIARGSSLSVLERTGHGYVVPAMMSSWSSPGLPDKLDGDGFISIPTLLRHIFGKVDDVVSSMYSADMSLALVSAGIMSSSRMELHPTTARESRRTVLIGLQMEDRGTQRNARSFGIAISISIKSRIAGVVKT